MFNIKELSQLLKTSFNWHGAGLDLLAKFFVALFGARSVNLTKLAEMFAGGAKRDSHYNRLQRIFQIRCVRFGTSNRIGVKTLSAT